MTTYEDVVLSGLLRNRINMQIDVDMLIAVRGDLL